MNAPATLEAMREHWAAQPAELPTARTPQPEWLAALHRGAGEVFGETAFPQRRDEAWRYTSVDSLLGQSFSTLADTTTTPALSDWPALSEAPACRLVTVNGRWRPDLSTLGTLPEGVTVTGLAAAIASMPERVGEWIGRIPVERLHSFSALNSSALEDGVLVHLEPGCVLERPIEVLHLGGGAAPSQAGDAVLLNQARCLIVLEENAQATLIERFGGGPAESYFHNGVGEARLQAGARLDHHRLQQQSAAAWHLDALFVHQQRDSRYRSTLYSLGGRWARNEVNIALHGEGAECELTGTGSVGTGQLNDLHLSVEHLAPRCRSHSAYRCLLHGKGRGVFDGRILVAQDAQHSDARLSNANLLLERSAEIDTKPVLEILADDVRCSHGATVGRLDPQQLFYLRSRGIDAPAARRMLALGFAASTLEACPIDALRAEVERDIGARLDAGSGAPAAGG
jgi:Fe-S cluster assembly protein SufD